MRINHFHFVTPVWGHSHINTFLELGLPTLLSKDNIPGMLTRSNSSYQIYTRPSDLIIFEHSPVFKILKEIIPVEISFISEEIENPHLMMSHCHRLALQKATIANAGTVFIPPDCIWSDGSMVNLEKIVMQDICIVHMSGLRVKLENMREQLKKIKENSDELSLPLNVRELIKLGIQYLHPITNDLFFREKSKKLMPANLLWSVENQGVLARCFHLHPLFIEPNPVNHNFKTTIDDDLGLQLDAKGNRQYIVSDSDEIFAFELSQSSHVVAANYEKGSITDIAAWAEVGMNKRHRQLVQIPIRIHYTDITPRIWEPVENEAKEVVEKALNLVDQSIYYLLQKGYHNNLWHRLLALKLKKEESFFKMIGNRLKKLVLMFIIFCYHKNKYYLHFVKYYVQRTFHHGKYYKHQVVHYSKYYLQRLLHHSKYYKHQVLHYSKYYLQRLLHRGKYYNHQTLHYSKYYLQRLFHHGKYYKHQALHYSKYYARRLLHHGKYNNHQVSHYSKYYLQRLLHQARYYTHQIWHCSKYYINRSLYWGKYCFAIRNKKVNDRDNLA